MPASPDRRRRRRSSSSTRDPTARSDRTTRIDSIGSPRRSRSARSSTQPSLRPCRRSPTPALAAPSPGGPAPAPWADARPRCESRSRPRHSWLPRQRRPPALADAVEADRLFRGAGAAPGRQVPPSSHALGPVNRLGDSSAQAIRHSRACRRAARRRRHRRSVRPPPPLIARTVARAVDQHHAR